MQGAPGPGEIRYWSEECYRVLGYDSDKGLPPVKHSINAFTRMIEPGS